MQKTYAQDIRRSRCWTLDTHTPGYGSELPNKKPEDKLLGAPYIKLYQAAVGPMLCLGQYTLRQLLLGQSTYKGVQQAQGSECDHDQPPTLLR